MPERALRLGALVLLALGGVACVAWALTTSGPTEAGRVPAGPPLSQYPRPQMTRSRWLNLNGEWQFEGMPVNGPPPIGRALAGQILVPFPPESRLSGVDRHYDHMWYRRTFTIPPGWLPARCGGGGCPEGCAAGSCPRILLHFGAVDYAASVYVNGRLMATHRGGYDAFTVDITPALRPGATQELVVGVTDLVERNPLDQVVGKQRLSAPGAIWYEPSSGIWQTVWLEPVPAEHIDRLALAPDLSAGSLIVDALSSGATDSGGSGGSGPALQVTATAYAGSRPVGRVSGPANAPLSLPVPDARLWSPADPYLYNLTVTLSDGGQIVDQVGSYFGMRSIAVGLDGGRPHMLLNGRFVFELGTLQQGYWPDGLYTARSDAALRDDLATDRRLGFNTIREHMAVEPDRFYYWADRLGLLVWQDMPALARQPTGAAPEREFESELHGVIDQLSDHPSIVVWTLFNEGWGEFDPVQLTALVRSWDPTRLIDTDSGQNCCRSLPDTGSGDLYDEHTYPDPRARVPFDGRAVVDGELGGFGLAVPGHMWSRRYWAWQRAPNAAQLTSDYVRALSDVAQLEIHCGLSGAIYTQAYDVQNELDGLQTYDRAVLKPAASAVRAANAAVLEAAGRLAPGGCTRPPKASERR